MKTIIIESTDPLSWYFIADSALVNGGKPFFIPEFAQEFEAFLAPVVRISRIGKSVGRRFADRYYEEIAPAVHFRASALRRKLIAAGLPPDASHSFDRAMTVGEFRPAAEMTDGTPLVMKLTHKHEEKTEVSGVAECDTTALDEKIGKMLEAVSMSNTVKMGDYLVAELSKPLKVSIGDTLSVYHGDELLLTILIK